MAWPSKNHPTAIHTNTHMEGLTPFWSGLFFPFEPSAMDESKNKTKKIEEKSTRFLWCLRLRCSNAIFSSPPPFFFAPRPWYSSIWAAGQEQDISETGLTLSVECLACFSSGYGSNSSSGSASSFHIIFGPKGSGFLHHHLPSLLLL